MASKVPGLVIAVPPTAKLPCSWMISGTGLSFRLIVVHAEATMPAAISKSVSNAFPMLRPHSTLPVMKFRATGPSRRAASFVRLQVLARGPEQDLVHVHVLRLADGEGDGPRERVGRNRERLIELVKALGDVRLADAVRQFRGHRPGEITV